MSFQLDQQFIAQNHFSILK